MSKAVFSLPRRRLVSAWHAACSIEWLSSQIALSAASELKSRPFLTNTLQQPMLDQLKHVMSRPLTGNAPAEKNFSMSPQSKLEKADPSTAFQRSGWAYI
ncbi:hypothetical protein GQ600_27975 [Phytophthora cactorum]|nr:hypothetical protein GQ600_27975 [Phytophthora cactorum]